MLYPKKEIQKLAPPVGAAKSMPATEAVIPRAERPIHAHLTAPIYMSSISSNRNDLTGELMLAWELPFDILLGELTLNMTINISIVKIKAIETTFLIFPSFLKSKISTFLI